MKWGSKKKRPPPISSSSSSSSQPFLISHVFPTSWLSKFKQKRGNSEPKPSKVNNKGKQNSPSLGSPRRAAAKGGGRFYGVVDDDDDAFWRLSFGEDSAEGKKNRGVLRSVWFDSDDEFEVPPSSCGSCPTSDRIVKGRDLSQKLKGMQKSGNAKEWKLRKENRELEGKKKLMKLERDADKAEETSTETIESDEVEMLAARKFWATETDARKHQYASSLNSRNSSLKTIQEEALNLETEEPSEEKQTSDWQKLKERKIQEVKSKSEKHRKSLYISRELQRRRTKRSSKVRVCSPRTASRVEICKIKALENMTKAKMKMKRVAKEEAVQQVRTGLNSFAVVKCSFDPQQDFRDSMFEMIVEKKITQPEDLEELLACYLTLNSDEYHDLIVKVFRQVWFDLNQASFSAESQNEQCSSD